MHKQIKADLKTKTSGYAHWIWQRFENQHENAFPLETFIGNPLDEAVHYTAVTAQRMYYAYVEKCILDIPELIAQHLLQSAEIDTEETVSVILSLLLRRTAMQTLVDVGCNCNSTPESLEILGKTTALKENGNIVSREIRNRTDKSVY